MVLNLPDGRLVEVRLGFDAGKYRLSLGIHGALFQGHCC
ncbi:hypothetical protein SS05631_c17260 [Sinorhizobium sp. CCBAU 05631]|nr:hypothetical protein SS05631_c17260 [Sinorhizobium sp. CCBAU 05631]